jgi:sporulation protein YtfJ
MTEHPIQGLMKTAMESLKGMVDVNTVVGDPVETQDGSIIIPVSRVAFGFAAGGGEYSTTDAGHPGEFPFGGGSGAGVSVSPMGFLVVDKERVRMLPVEGGQPIDRLIDLVPQLIEKFRRASGRVDITQEPPGPDTGVPRTTASE